MAGRGSPSSHHVLPPPSPARAFCLALGLVACSGNGAGADRDVAPVVPSGPPSAAELAVATYSGPEAAATVTLANGRWQGPPFVEGGASRPTVTLLRGSRVTGDLDGDAVDEAVVLLAESSGGSGTLLHLAVMDRIDGGVVNVGSRVLGDRVQVRSLAVQDGTIRLEVVRTGPGDPACCPGELATYHWKLGDTGLDDRHPEEVTGRLSLAVLEGDEWRLVRFDRDSPAPDSPAVTLRYGDGRFTGSAGCSRYSVSVVDRTSGPAGGVATGPPVTERRSCDAPATVVEERFLRLLGSTIRFGFGAGRLLLYHATGAMSWERSAAPPE